MEEENTKHPLARSETKTIPVYENRLLGMRFAPTDKELLLFYLYKKLVNEPMPYDGIKEVKVYDYSPQFLAEFAMAFVYLILERNYDCLHTRIHLSTRVVSRMYPPLSENAWYFFTLRDRKYPRGTRPNRLTKGNGYWKATGREISIINNGETIGSKVALAFYQGKPQKGEKTNWLMHEFKVKKTDNVKFDDYVLCRIYKKKVKSSRNQKEMVDNRDLVEYPSQILPTQTGPVIDNVGGMIDTKELLINRSKGLCFPPDFSNDALSEVAPQLMVPPVAKFKVGGVPQYCIEYPSQGYPVIDKVQGVIDSKGLLINRFKDHCVPTDSSNGSLREVAPLLMVPSVANFEFDGVSRYRVKYPSQIIPPETGPVIGNVQGMIDTKGLLINGFEDHCVPIDSSNGAFSEVHPLLTESPVSSFEVGGASMYRIEYLSQIIPAEICPVIDDVEGTIDVNGVLINGLEDSYVQSILSNGTYSEVSDPLMESPIVNSEVDEASLVEYWKESQAHPPAFPLETDAASKNVSECTRNNQDEEDFADCTKSLDADEIINDVLKDLDV